MSCDLSNEPSGYGGAAAPAAPAVPAVPAAPAAHSAARLIAHPNFISFKDLSEKYGIDFDRECDASGGFGTIFYGIDPKIKLPVVAKRVNTKPTQKNPFPCFDTIVQEALIGLSLQSEELCKVYGFSLDSRGFFYIIMERINGPEVFDFLEKHPKLGLTNPEVMLSIVADIASGLSYLHDRKIVHRDIKLENIMLRKKDDGGDDIKSAVIIDFGFTMFEDKIPPDSEVGTIFYLAPEIVQKKLGASQKSADIYALGVIMFVSIFAYFPVWSLKKNELEERCEVYRKLLRQSESIQLPPYTGDDENVILLWNICKKCLEFDPSARPTAEELLEMLSS